GDDWKVTCPYVPGAGNTVTVYVTMSPRSGLRLEMASVVTVGVAARATIGMTAATTTAATNAAPQRRKPVADMCPRLPRSDHARIGPRLAERRGEVQTAADLCCHSAPSDLWSVAGDSASNTLMFRNRQDR